MKKEEPLDRSTTALTISTSSPNAESTKREPSPELARISALVIRPSKPTKNPSKPMAAAGGGNILDGGTAAVPGGFEPPALTESSPPLPQHPPPSTHPLTLVPKFKSGGLKLKAKDIGKKPQLNLQSEPNKVAYYYVSIFITKAFIYNIYAK